MSPSEQTPPREPALDPREPAVDPREPAVDPHPPSTPPDAPLRVVGGRYRLERSIGSGGMGTVWAGRDELLGRPVAVKEVRFPGGLGDREQRELRERTLREARAMARLSHPNIVTTYDVVEENGRPWIVMELLPSRTLSTVLREEGPLPPTEVADLGLAMLGALEISHQQGVVHRDVKPGNVLLTPDGRPVLTDFGIATMAGDPALTSTGVVLGSPAYMSPERARGQRPGPEADLWSLGATLYAAVEGRPPYDSDNALGTLTAVISEPVDPPSVDGPLREAILGLLAKDPARRLDVEQTRRLLERAAADRSGTTVPTPVPEPQALDRAGRTEALPAAAPPASPLPPQDTTYGGARRRTRRGVGVAALVLVLVLLALGVSAFLSGRGGDDPGPSGASGPTTKATDSGQPTTGPSDSPRNSPSNSPSHSSSDSGSPSSSPPSTSQTGSTTYSDPSGFSVAVPRGWAVSRSGTQVRFDDPGGAQYLLVDQTDSPRKDPKKDWQRQEKSVQQRLPNYDRISIEEVDYRGYPAADWEFTYGTQTQVVDRGFVVGGRGYALYVQGPRGTFDRSRAVFQRAADTFRPAG